MDKSRNSGDPAKNECHDHSHFLCHDEQVEDDRRYPPHNKLPPLGESAKMSERGKQKCRQHRQIEAGEIILPGPFLLLLKSGSQYKAIQLRIKEQYSNYQGISLS